MEAFLNDSNAMQQRFLIADASQVAQARRGVGELARARGFTETAAGRMAIIVTECGTNMLKHAKDGELLARPLSFDDASASVYRTGSGPGASALLGRYGIEILALDKGPGIRDLYGCFEDGYTTAGSPGTGLGAIRRLSDELDVWSMPGRGVVLRAVVWGDDSRVPPPGRAIEYGVVNLPLASETVSGDAWGIHHSDAGLTVMIADGLGHGPLANAAALAALRALGEQGSSSLTDIMNRTHVALHPTRGAAIGIARVGGRDEPVRFAGVGNIAASVSHGGGRRQLMSHDGIVGNNLRKVQEVDTPWPAAALLVMHSDGLTLRWDLMQYPGLMLRHPGVIAGVLYRDYTRGTDDVTVLTLRAKEPARTS